MRGYPRFNFDAFDVAARDLAKRGYFPINPADLDREAGVDPEHHEVTPAATRAAIERDVDAIMGADAVALLPGWERSKGAVAEAHIAKWADKRVLRWPDLSDVDLTPQ